MPRLLGRALAQVLAAFAAVVPQLVFSQTSWDAWRNDPFETKKSVAPDSSTRWHATTPLPAVPMPEPAGELTAARPLSLPELTEFALRNNPRTRQAWLSALAAAAGVGLAKADDLPTVTGILGFTRARPVSATSGAASPWLNRYGPSISFSYVLFDFGAGDDKLDAAKYRLLAANLAHNRALQDVMFLVEQAYYQVLGTEALVRVNEQLLKNVQTALEAARRRRESGLATVADVYRAETQVAQSQLALTRSRGEFDKARGQLATAVGLPIHSTIRVQTLVAPPQIQEIVGAVGDYLEKAKSSRPDLIAAEAQARAARASANAAAKAGLPTIEISGNSALTEYTSNWHPDRPSTRAHTWTLNLRIPIFSGFRDTYAARQAEAQAAQAEAARDVLFRQSQLEVWQAYYDLRTVTTGIASTEAQVKSAEQTAQATLARYQAGFGSILDLITAQQDEATARTQRVQSYLDWFTTLARLHYSIGMSDLPTTASIRK
jgi:outer membrane protein TolC